MSSRIFSQAHSVSDWRHRAPHWEGKLRDRDDVLRGMSVTVGEAHRVYRAPAARSGRTTQTVDARCA